MSDIDVQRDPDALTLTITARFAAPPERVWGVWSNPRTLERWWGPPTYPATVTAHDLTPGGRVEYFMTGPEGGRHFGWWEITSVDEPLGLAFRDGFADADGTPSELMPVIEIVVSLTEQADGTEMRVVSHFASVEVMEQLVQMGMPEGMQLAMGQIPALLEE